MSDKLNFLASFASCGTQFILEYEMALYARVTRASNVSKATGFSDDLGCDFTKSKMNMKKNWPPIALASHAFTEVML